MTSPQIASPFPDTVAFSLVHTSVLQSEQAHPEELQALSPRAVPSRRREFSLGRIAARRALASLGQAGPVGIGAGREPLWPEGFVGSITHSGDVAAGAAAPLSTTAGLGLDLEDSRRVKPDMEPLIADPEERRWTAGDPLRLAQLFSAKESLFKALYRFRQEHFGYDAVRLHPIAEGFVATLREDMGSYRAKGAELGVKRTITGSWVLTSVLLPA